MTGLSTAPAKVRLVALDDVTVEESVRMVIVTVACRDYVSKQSLFRGSYRQDPGGLEESSERSLARRSSVVGASSGCEELQKAASIHGEALDWSRLDFSVRTGPRWFACCVMQCWPERDHQRMLGPFLVRMGGHDILVELHAIPAALSVGAARESVGQPFLRDHLQSKCADR